MWGKYQRGAIDATEHLFILYSYFLNFYVVGRKTNRPNFINKETLKVLKGAMRSGIACSLVQISFVFNIQALNIVDGRKSVDVNAVCGFGSKNCDLTSIFWYTDPISYQITFIRPSSQHN